MRLRLPAARNDHGSLPRRVSQLRLYRFLIGVRWFVVAMLPLQVGLGQQGSHRTFVIGAIAAAAVYTLVLTLVAKPVLALMREGPIFSVVDMAVVFAIYATGPLTEWSFFLFGTTTVLMAGLRGKVSEAIVSAIAWNALTFLATVAWRLPPSQVFGIATIEDLFNIAMFGAVWSYSVGTVGRLNGAYDELAEGAEALELANARLDDREQEIMGLMEAGNAVMRELDLVTILEIVADALSKMGFGPSRIWVLDEGVFRVVFPTEGHIADVPAVSSGLLAEAVRRGGPVIAAPGEDDVVPGFDPSKPAVAVPVLTQEDIVGVLAVESVAGDGFEDDEVEMLTLFADQAALALQHVRFLEQTQELAVAEERLRIAREIHDTVVQKLYGANLIAEALCAESSQPEATEKLHVLQETILASLKDLRFAVLNWDSLEWRTEIAGLVERYAAEFSALTGIAVSVVLRGDDARCGPSRSKDLLRILQAALSNVWRHARARSVQVDLDGEAPGIGLTVRDDGRGFDVAEAAASPSVGLADMKDRSQRHGGTIEIESAPGDGTSVRVWMPC